MREKLDKKSIENWEIFLDLSGLPDISKDRLHKVEISPYNKHIRKIKIKEDRVYTGKYLHTRIDGGPDLRYKDNFVYIDVIKVQIWAYGKYFNIIFYTSKKNRNYISNLQSKLTEELSNDVVVKTDDIKQQKIADTERQIRQLQERLRKLKDG